MNENDRAFAFVHELDFIFTWSFAYIDDFSLFAIVYYSQWKEQKNIFDFYRFLFILLRLSRLCRCLSSNAHFALVPVLSFFCQIIYCVRQHVFSIEDITTKWRHLSYSLLRLSIIVRTHNVTHRSRSRNFDRLPFMGIRSRDKCDKKKLHSPTRKLRSMTSTLLAHETKRPK